jgi:DNA-binding transcriptional regulator YdaS (Cro superfamily)
MTVDDVKNLLIAQCDQAGSQKAWASRHGLSEGYVCDTIRGRRAPGGAILRALGLKRAVSYNVDKEV